MTSAEPSRGATPRKRDRATMQDVADAAGVSLTTVSHALSGKGRVDAETRELVRSTADRLGFVPNRAARSLASGRTFTIGLSLPELRGLTTDELLESDWYGQVIVAAARHALHRDYVVTILPHFTSATDLRRYSVDGVVVLEAAVGDRRLAALARARVPHVSTDHDPKRPGVLHVRVDAEAGARALVEHLRDQGARRILLLAGAVQLQYFEDAVGAARALAAKGLAVEHRTVDGGSRTEMYGAVREATRKALTSKRPPDAIVGMFEGFGPNIVAAAEALGRSVPGDLLVAQDIDGASARTSPPGITAIEQHASVQATRAVDLLIDQIDGVDGLTSLTTPVTLMVRGSSSAGA